MTRAHNDWPAFEVERKPISGLKPYDKNARTHSKAQVEQVARSISEWGWTQPILIDPDGLIIAGHCRLEAAKLMGVDEVPVVTARGWTDEQKKAYTLADNQIASNSGWDSNLLADELKGLNGLDFDMSLLGFDEDMLAGILDEPLDGNTDPDDVPDLPEVAVTEPGDLWVLGNHRLLCGDSTVETDVSRLLDGVKPHLMVTDPPYGVEYDADWRNHALRADGSADGGRAIGKVSNDDKADWSEAWALFPGDVAYVWHAGNKANVVADSLIACDFNIRAQIIWAKNNIVIGRGDYHPKHEPCWYAVKKNRKGHYRGDRKQTTVWNIDKPQKSETGHSTQKPIECMRKPIENNSSQGQAVYDPFLGSGTTIIAAEQTGRHCYGLELSPAYCDVIIKRWQDFTGEDATLDGRTFSEVSNNGKE